MVVKTDEKTLNVYRPSSLFVIYDCRVVRQNNSNAYVELVRDPLPGLRHIDEGD